MKRIIVLIAILAVISLAACGAEPLPPTEAPTEPVPQLHTLAPTEAVAEPEWVPVDSDLTLERGGEVYAQGEDFERFALVEDDGVFCLKFGLGEFACAVLGSQGSVEGFSLALNGEDIGGVSLSADCAELTLIGDYTYDELCVLATRIRGLE